MSLIGRSTGNRTLISDNTFKNDLPKYKKIFYRNILDYIDQYAIYNYMKVTDPHYGFTWQDNNNLFIEANLSTTLELLLYFHRHRDDTNVDEEKLQQIKKDLNDEKFEGL